MMHLVIQVEHLGKGIKYVTFDFTFFLPTVKNGLQSDIFTLCPLPYRKIQRHIQTSLINSRTRKVDKKVLQEQFLCTVGKQCIFFGEKSEITIAKLFFFFFFFSDLYHLWVHFSKSTLFWYT